MKIQENYSLKDHHTLWFNIFSQYFVEVQALEDVIALTKNPIRWTVPYYILGEWSNTFFTSDYQWIVIHNTMQNITLLEKNDDEILIEVWSWVIWDDFIDYCIERGYYGIENLAAIPWTIGASPVQNIGAYGVEAKDTIDAVQVHDLISWKTFWMSNRECEFGYRTSIFKHRPELFVICVRFELFDSPEWYTRKLSYPDCEKYIKDFDLISDNLTALQIAQMIRKIRWAKLPDRRKVWTAWSFFKNPIVTPEKLEEMKSIDQHIKYFPWGDNYKLAAWYLIEMSGCKWLELWHVWTHKDHALILIHDKQWKPEQFVDLITLIQWKVLEKYGVELEPEVVIL